MYVKCVCWQYLNVSIDLNLLILISDNDNKD